jgi:hypothetical protein
MMAQERTLLSLQESGTAYDSTDVCFNVPEIIFPPSRQVKLDWTEVNKYYLANPTSSYRDLSERFNVSLKQVKKHGTRQGFARGRQRVTDLTQTKIEENLANERITANQRHIEIYQRCQALLMANVEAMEAQLDAAEVEDRPLTGRALPNPTQLKTLSSALVTVINAERVCLGLPTSVAPAPIDWKPTADAHEPSLSLQELLTLLGLSSSQSAQKL